MNGVGEGVGGWPNGLGVGIGANTSGEIVGGVLPCAEPAQATAVTARIAGNAVRATRFRFAFIIQPPSRAYWPERSFLTVFSEKMPVRDSLESRTTRCFSLRSVFPKGNSKRAPVAVRDRWLRV